MLYHEQEKILITVILVEFLNNIVSNLSPITKLLLSPLTNINTRFLFVCLFCFVLFGGAVSAFLIL